MAFPLAVAIYAIHVLFVREISIGDRSSWTFHGLNAIAFGVAACAAALFTHGHYFWGNIYSQAWFAVLGKIIGACAFIAALIFVLVRNGVMGIG
jgi:hypothetical protein